MNNSMILKTVRETRISEFYRVDNVFTAEDHKTLFTDAVVIGFLLTAHYTIFLVPEYDEDFPIQDRLAYDARQYSNQDLLNLFDGEYPYVVDQIIVCTPYEVTMQRPSKISETEVNPPLCSACGNPCCTCDPTYEEFQQSEYDKYYALEQKVDDMEQLDRAVKRPPSEIRNILPAYMLDKEPYGITAKFFKNDMSTFKFFKEFLDTHEYVYAISEPQSGEFLAAYLIGGDSSWTIDEYFMNFNQFYAVELNQDAKDRAEFMNAIGNNQAAPVDELTNTYWLASEVTQSAINVTLVIVLICSLVLGWLFSFNSLLLTAIGCIITLLFYNVWVSTYLNRDRNLSREAFNEKYGK